MALEKIYIVRHGKQNMPRTPQADTFKALDRTGLLLIGEMATRLQLYHSQISAQEKRNWPAQGSTLGSVWRGMRLPLHRYHLQSCMTLVTGPSSGISRVFLVLVKARQAHGYILLAILFVASQRITRIFVNRC